jgi:hypothetical protein
MRTDAEINAEIKKLRDMKPNVRMTSAFGDNHHNAIDAQIRVLDELMDEEDIETIFDDDAQNVRDEAYNALQWMLGEDEYDAPSQGWQELVR